MATKNTKSVGNILGQSREYWQNAAKQFIWPIDFDALHICVPEKDLQMAKDNLMVMHFRNAGWHIQSTIDVEYNKPYIAPVSDKPIFRPTKKEVEEKEPEFKFNQRFRVKSTECELKISEITKKSIKLSYTNRQKSDIITTPENLSKSIKLGSWLII